MKTASARRCALAAPRRSARTGFWPAACTTTAPTPTATRRLGDSASEQVTEFLAKRREALGIDDAVLTDHSDAFVAAYQRTVDAGASVADTGQDFSLLRRFEWTNDQQNHLNVLFSQNWTSRAATGDASLQMPPFWTWLSTAPTVDPSGAGLGFGGSDGVGTFNHPGDKGALNWDDYALNPGDRGRARRTARNTCLASTH